MGSVIPLKKEISNSYLELKNLVGNKLAVEFMKVWLAKGPSAAIVETVEFVNCEDPGLEDFEVRD